MEEAMFIDTTYVMCEDVIALLAEAEEKTKRPKEELLVLAMRMMLKDSEAYFRTDGRIEYQKRIDNDTGKKIKKHRVKMKVNFREYDYYQDMRRIFRRSISLVMAIAVRTYIAIIVEAIVNKTEKTVLADTYPFENYAIFINRICYAQTFRIWWGVPANPELLFIR